MIKQGLHKTLINKVWRNFFLFLFLTQLFLIIFIFGYGTNLATMRLANTTEKLTSIVRVVALHSDPILMEQVITEITKNNKIAFKPSQVTTDAIGVPLHESFLSFAIKYKNAIPLYLTLQAINSAFDDLCKDCYTISYQITPPMIWIGSKRPPYFSLGITPIAHILFLKALILFLWIAFFSAIGLAWWVNKRITQPLSKLSHHALNIINESAVTNISLDTGSLSEVTVLADALNKMHADINSLIKDRELFLAEISHDLRTPLSRLNMAVQMQDVYITEHAGSILEANLSKYAEGMRTDIKEMSQIINQTMELAHVNNALNEPWLDADINALLIEIKAKYQRAGISLNLDLDTTLPALRFKQTTFTRMLYNLIDNALKYGNGEIHIVSAMDGLIATISIINPIADLDLNNDSSSGSNKLGLEIVKRISEMHNIVLAVTNDSKTNTYQVKLSFNSAT